jgi:hypothetical protein
MPPGLIAKICQTGAMIALTAAHRISTEEMRSPFIKLPQRELRLAEEQAVRLQRAAGGPQTTRGIKWKSVSSQASHLLR